MRPPLVAEVQSQGAGARRQRRVVVRGTEIRMTRVQSPPVQEVQVVQAQVLHPVVQAVQVHVHVLHPVEVVQVVQVNQTDNLLHQLCINFVKLMLHVFNIYLNL